MKPRKTILRARSQSWDPVAHWYAGWAGQNGSHYHRTFAVPLMLDLLAPKGGEQLLDLGCGHGILAPSIASTGARYLGVDLSGRLVAEARRNQARYGRFLVGDATALPQHKLLAQGAFDAASFLLSIQDINPLEQAVAEAARLLRPGGRLGIVMLHPCFRIPRQSGWGHDEGRGLTYRRVDTYLSRLAIPMQVHGAGSTRSYHRPLEDYMAALTGAGLVVTAIREVADLPGKQDARADRRAMREFPLFLGLRAVKLE
ncbi:class I SAM-dependent methyltransferase [Devosia sp. XK-2]|uniref:class I SAM-dependent methyltransferase n=1 Tax=Devosia sp. XK-2 TaxID=3126689 RepID=UPI0030CC1F35